MTNNKNGCLSRGPVLLWIFIPALFIFFGFNYLHGILNEPRWSITIPEVTRAQKPETFEDMRVFTIKNFRFFNKIQTGFVTFWFDDAWESQMTQGLPILTEKKFPAALAVPTRAVGTHNYMSWADIRYLNSIGWEITAHSRSHQCHVSEFTDEDIIGETYGSKIDLLKQGLFTDIYVTPCSSQTDQTLAFIKKFFLTLRTGVGGINPVPVENAYQVYAFGLKNNTSLLEIRDWIRQTQKRKGWLILMFHQIDNSQTEYAVTPDFLRSIVDEVAASGLTVALPTEVLTIPR
ncbi:hypothetical protein A2154_01630 [Candidatus Gottesmanbacteria bacterium RBG_16_43_7]|uniref:NodB homology domain-containing protein n=1 Tax=Candidatus Gottesmanbacteria bacterium RBG_16_43_7 TaxID=1798373 RepID=A0A1F5ZBF6_9BACT|nr:MAG: hypothetical protein A2154_01630 [Candidatus Gottesmanbacteria bacterium RBG_16_43_7]